MIKVKRYITCILIFAMVLTSAVTMTVGEVNAAAKGTGEDLSSHAEMKAYQGKTLSGVKNAMRKAGHNVWDYKGDWCAWYVSQCATNIGLSSVIPSESWSCNMPARIIMAGGHVTFLEKEVQRRAFIVNHDDAKQFGTKHNHYGTSAKKEKSRYELKKRSEFRDIKRGDLIFFDGLGNYNGIIDHVEIVTGVKNGRVYTVGGDVGSKVSKQSYGLNTRKIVAYARPNYPGKQTFTIKYNANGGTGSMANTTVTYGTKTPLRANQFVKDGYKFVGWTAKRDNNTWRYIQSNGSKDGWYAEGKQPSGWKKFVYHNQDTVWQTYNKNKGVVTFYAQWEKAPVHTFYYDVKGGSVTPPSMQIAEGARFSITQVLPEKEGCTFAGWTIRRTADNKCYVTGKGWFTDAEIKSKGYTKRIYTPGENYPLDNAWTSGYNGVSNYIFEAQWKEIPAEQMHQITFDAMGGKGDYETLFVQTGGKIVIPFTVPEKDGYDFLGWAVYRVSDGKYFSLEEGWRTPQVISQKGLSKKLYPADSWYNLNDSWTYGCQGISDYVFEAQWEKNASQEPVEKPDIPQTPISEPEVIGYVSESEYYAKYAGNSDYDVTTYYRYATRQKEYTESTASSMAGWILYNQVTTPGSSTWSKTKPASGAYETGYQYYCWGWEHKGDWTFYYDDNYNDAVAWIKKNYTVWNYNQFRYFWQVYSTNKGSSVKVSQTVNYRDSAGKTGTKAISDTKLWYDGVVYRQKASTKYQYWRWSDWSAWSGWSTQKQTTGDTVKEERQYYVVKK